MQTSDPKKLYIIFTLFALIGLFVSTFVAFNQAAINEYIIVGFGLMIMYFGLKGIYKTRQSQSKEKK